MNITDISGIGDATAKLLKTHGIDSVEAVATAEIEQLAAVPGIGPSRAAALRASARRMLPDTTAGAESPDAGPAPAGDAEAGSETAGDFEAEPETAGDTEAGAETVAAPAGDDANAKRTKGGKGKRRKKKKKGKKGKKSRKGKKKEGKAEKKKNAKKKDKRGRKKKNKRK